MKILCICHANVCRSFMAQEFLKQLLPDAVVFSRGIYADPYYEVPAKVKNALAARHITQPLHTPAPLACVDLQQADLVFCMEERQADWLLDRYAQYTDKIWLLTEYAFDTPQDIVDPIGLDGRVFEKQAARLYDACAAAAKRMTQEKL